ncbi:uncharacterized protein Dvar_72030 [Desulfosarcina variabilis str. Montpellier]|uniref:hypothetical protein n=1 Tax=Desulfosarcina variabilis TaxID=2300 RepID=UPI003AFA1EAF
MKNKGRINDILDKQMQEAAVSNQWSSANETNVGRREFIKTAGLSAIALGAGFSAIPAFAKEASSATYKPVTSNYMQVHKDLVVIDGTTNLTGLGTGSRRCRSELNG